MKEFKVKIVQQRDGKFRFDLPEDAAEPERIMSSFAEFQLNFYADQIRRAFPKADPATLLEAAMYRLGAVGTLAVTEH